ncbi:hypothetical protein L7F22_001602 [Adiantum nelumboides]|nr:hypothetical protein [Adiantum nelumboides]
MALSSGSPCAACKFLRRKCATECVFAPYFPPEDPQKFANVHKLFGASNVSKLLTELPLCVREDTVNSLAYEAHARIRDPVYGCAGAISILQCRVALLQAELIAARSELCKLKAQTSNNLLERQLCKLPPDHILSSHQLHQVSSPYFTLLQSKHAAMIHPTSDSTPIFSDGRATATAAPSLASPNIQSPARTLACSASSSTFPSASRHCTSCSNCKEESSPPFLSETSFFKVAHSPAASTFTLSDQSSGVGRVHASCDTD